MDAFALIFLALGLAMDAFAVSLCKGLAMKRPSVRSVLIVGLWFGFFQAMMPVIGYFLGKSFYDFISSFAHWVALALLCFIGLNMIREALSDEEEELDDSIGFRTMLLLAIATSIDALAAGISLAMDNSDIMFSAVVIGIVTFAISALGVGIGAKVGERFGSRAEIAGGLILILLGINIVVQHYCA